jgi:hypothetical protein
MHSSRSTDRIRMGSVLESRVCATPAHSKANRSMVDTLVPTPRHMSLANTPLYNTPYPVTAISLAGNQPTSACPACSQALIQPQHRNSTSRCINRIESPMCCPPPTSTIRLSRRIALTAPGMNRSKTEDWIPLLGSPVLLCTALPLTCSERAQQSARVRLAVLDTIHKTIASADLLPSSPGTHPMSRPPREFQDIT